MDPTLWSPWAPWVAIGVALLGVLAGFFKEDIAFWRRRNPRLATRILMRSPDCQKLPVESYNPASGMRSVMGERYYFRLWVANNGKARAEQVQVFVARIEREGADGRFRPLAGFLPMNLCWAHANPPRAFADGVSPRMGAYVDLGFASKPQSLAAMENRLPDVPVGQIVFHVTLEVEPTSRGHILRNGTYHLELLIAAANAMPRATHLELVVGNDWFDNEEEMLQKGVTVREIK